ncbi:MAG: VWA domain-containing protein [Elusimicrobia bacterium]|nr:VWA domain-containing protein [Candidatus Liberimonas magnetica]
MNLSFLNISILWALPVVLLPLILHLFFKKNPKKQEFSDFRFIYLALQKLQNKFRLRQYLLLLTRMLILFLLVLFFAKPILQFNLQKGSESKDNLIALVLLIDTSYSMDYNQEGRPRFEHNKVIAKKIISMLSARDRIGIIAYSNRIEAATPSLSNDKKYLLKIIDELKVTNRPTDFSAAWPVLKQLLGQFPASNQAAVVLSDLASHGFNTTLPEDDRSIKVFYFKPKGGDNYWLNEVKAGFSDVQNMWNIESVCRFDSGKYPFLWPVNYFIDNKKAGSDVLDVSSKDKIKVFFSCPGETDGLPFRARLEQDNLDRDNNYYLLLDQPKKCKTWIVDGDPRFGGVTSESFYLKNALLNAVTVGEDKVDETQLKPPGVVILANLRKDHENIDRFINSGGGALIFLGDRTADEFNPDYLPGNIGSRFEKTQSINWESKDHVLNKLMDMSEFEIANIAVNQGFVLQAKPGSQVLASLSSGWPYLLESKYGDGRVILCATRANREWGNIVSKTVFMPLIKNIAAYLSGGAEETNTASLKIGEAFRYKTSMPDSRVLKPDGTVVKAVKGGEEALFTDTEEPGIYAMVSGGRVIKKFAVNLDTSIESELSPAGDTSLKRYFSKNYLIKLDEANWESQFISAISGKDISRWLLLIIFLLIIAEIYLANPMSKKIN